MTFNRCVTRYNEFESTLWNFQNPRTQTTTTPKLITNTIMNGLLYYKVSRSYNGWIICSKTYIEFVFCCSQSHLLSYIVIINYVVCEMDTLMGCWNATKDCNDSVIWRHDIQCYTQRTSDASYTSRTLMNALLHQWQGIYEWRDAMTYVMLSHSMFTISPGYWLREDNHQQ